MLYIYFGGTPFRLLVTGLKVNLDTFRTPHTIILLGLMTINSTNLRYQTTHASTFTKYQRYVALLHTFQRFLLTALQRSWAGMEIPLVRWTPKLLNQYLLAFSSFLTFDRPSSHNDWNIGDTKQSSTFLEDNWKGWEAEGSYDTGMSNGGHEPFGSWGNRYTSDHWSLSVCHTLSMLIEFFTA